VGDIGLDKVGAACGEVEDWKTSSQAMASKIGIAVAPGKRKKIEKMRRISFKTCPHCGCSKIYGSSSSFLRQAVSFLFLLRLVRCHVCMRRHYRPIFVSTAENPARAKVATRGKAASVAAMAEQKRHQRPA
jgi:hypothetical protein